MRVDLIPSLVNQVVQRDLVVLVLLQVLEVLDPQVLNHQNHLEALLFHQILVQFHLVDQYLFLCPLLEVSHLLVLEGSHLVDLLNLVQFHRLVVL